MVEWETSSFWPVLAPSSLESDIEYRDTQTNQMREERNIRCRFGVNLSGGSSEAAHPVLSCRFVSLLILANTVQYNDQLASVVRVGET